MRGRGEIAFLEFCNGHGVGVSSIHRASAWAHVHRRVHKCNDRQLRFGHTTGDDLTRLPDEYRRRNGREVPGIEIQRNGVRGLIEEKHSSSSPTRAPRKPLFPCRSVLVVFFFFCFVHNFRSFDRRLLFFTIVNLGSASSTSRLIHDLGSVTTAVFRTDPCFLLSLISCPV